MTTTLRDNTEAARFEALVDGEVAGFATYRRREGSIALIHTEVDDAYEGEGLGSRLARFALDGAREAGLEVLPYCPFMASWIREHPDYVELVPQDKREKFGLAEGAA
jgi:predicted GNAT family acetyltransferase